MDQERIRRAWPGADDSERPGWARRAFRSARSVPLANRVMTASARWLLDHTTLDRERVHLRLPRLGWVERALPNGRSVRLWSDLDDDGIANRIYWYGWNGWEGETAEVLYRLARQAAVIVDVGAHVGLDTLIMAQARPTARVLAFEPHPQVYRRLCMHLTANGVDNVETFQVALAGEDRNGELVSPRAGIPTTSRVAPASASQTGDATGHQRYPVRLRRFDTMRAEAGLEGVRLVKIDTEGTEADVLKGMTGTLERDRPALVCEVLPEREAGPAIQAVLGRYDYLFYSLGPTGPRRHNQIVGQAGPPNYLMVPAEQRDACAEALETDLRG